VVSERQKLEAQNVRNKPRWGKKREKNAEKRFYTEA
jgi:hypothetical protein